MSFNFGRPYTQRWRRTRLRFAGGGVAPGATAPETVERRSGLRNDRAITAQRGCCVGPIGQPSLSVVLGSMPSSRTMLSVQGSSTYTVRAFAMPAVQSDTGYSTPFHAVSLLNYVSASNRRRSLDHAIRIVEGVDIVTSSRPSPFGLTISRLSTKILGEFYDRS